MCVGERKDRACVKFISLSKIELTSSYPLRTLNYGLGSFVYNLRHYFVCVCDIFNMLGLVTSILREQQCAMKHLTFHFFFTLLGTLIY